MDCYREKTASKLHIGNNDLAFQMNAHNMHRLHISRTMYIHNVKAYTYNSDGLVFVLLCIRNPSI